METQNSSGQISSSIPASDSTVLVTHGTISQGNRDLLPAGTMIGGAYKVITPIGKGGMGDVYRARHVVLQKDFAVKVLTGQELNNVNWLRFQTEAKVISKLDHKNVVKVYNLGLHNGDLPFYAMDLLEGEPLDGVISRLGPLDQKDAISIFLQVCDGLGYAHRHGVIHRDIKPANIMLIVESSDVPTVKLLDFGIAKLSTVENKAAQSLTAPGEIFGSPYYMSPEQCLGLKVDARSDIYSLGCTIYESLTGRPPFKGENAFKTICMHQSETPQTLSEVSGKSFSPAMEHLIAKCLRKKPEDRYQSMKEIEVDLLRLAQGKDLNPTYINLRDELAAQELDEDEEDINEAEAKAGNTKTLLWMGIGLASTLALVVSASMFFMTDKKATAVTGKNNIAQSSSTTDSGNKISRKPRLKSTIRKQDEAEVKRALDNGQLPALSAEREPVDETNEKNFAADGFEDIQKSNNFRGIDFNHGDTMLKGRQATLYIFPGYNSLGMLSWSAGTTPDGKQYTAGRVPASGEVYTPRGAHLGLELRPEANNDPAMVANFRDGELKSIMFKKCAEDGDGLIKHLSKITSLKDIDFTSSDVTDKSFGFIDQQKHLKKLTVKATGFSIAQLLKLKRLRQLKSLNVRELANQFDILPALRDDLELEELKLGDTPLSHKELNIIKTLKNLETLDLNSTSLSDDQLVQLGVLKKIKKLCVSDSNLSPNCLSIFKEYFPDLEELTISSHNPKWNKDLEKQLIKTIKFVKIVEPSQRNASTAFFTP
jgi:serine/threonine protein kinase